jgi:hypothetical protein
MTDSKRFVLAGLGSLALLGAISSLGGCGGDRSCPCAREDLTCTGGSGPAGGGSGGSGGGTSGTGGSGGGAEAGPGPELCETSGCAVLSAPIAVAGDKADFMIEFGESDLKDVSASVITFHVYVFAGSGGALQTFVRNGSTNNYLTAFQTHDLASLSGWTDLTVDVAALTDSTLDKTQIEAFGLQILANGTGPWTTPTVVYVDSITISNGAAGPWEFTTSAQPMAVNTYNSPVDGSLVDWIGPATGSAGAGGGG